MSLFDSWSGLVIKVTLPVKIKHDDDLLIQMYFINYVFDVIKRDVN